MYPSVFYFKVKSSDSLYSFTPQGQLHVGKLISNQPYWKKPNSAFEEHKKTLVLADWTGIYWSNAKKAAVKQVIARLMRDGFEIYLWQDGDSLPLNKMMLWNDNKDEEVLQKMTPESQDVIIEATLKQGQLVKDQVLVLDDYWIQALIDEQFDKPRHLAISVMLEPMTQNKLTRLTDATFKPKSDTRLESILALLDTLTPRIEKIWLDEYSTNSLLALKKIQNRCPGIPVEIAYRFLTICPRDASDLFENQELTVEDLVITFPQLSAIEKLILAANNPNYKKISAQVFQAIVAQAGTLKSLSLNTCKISGDILEPLSLIALESLDFHNVSLSAQSLKSLLAQSEQLKDLKLAHCKIVGDITDALRLTSLELLEFNNITLSAQTLGSLLAKSEKLKSLKLSGCTINGDISGALELTALERLDISYASISGQTLHGLLANSEKLKSLDLSSCTLSGDIPAALTLKALERLDLDDADLSTKSLHRLLASSGALKALRISSQFNNTPILEAFDLTSLETLELLRGHYPIAGLGVYEVTSTYSAPFLQGLLAKAENLKTFNLSDCGIEGDIEKSLDLHSLQILDLSNARLSAQSLRCLLANAGKLNSLNLANCQIKGKIEEALDLTALEILDLSHATFLNELLKLAKQKKLKMLNLSHCKINPTCLYYLTSLNELEILNLSNTKLSEISLRLLLDSLVKLKFLDLSGSAISSDVIQTVIQLNTLIFKSLETLILSDASISLKLLIALLNSSPHLKVLKLSKKNNLMDTNDATLNQIIQERGIAVSYDNQQFERNYTSQAMLDSPLALLKLESPHSAIHNNLAPKQYRSHLTQFVDADTQHNKKEFRLNQLFCGKDRDPHPSEYRLSIANRMTLSKASVSMDKAFSIENSDENELKAYTIEKSDLALWEAFKRDESNNNSLFYGKIKLILDQDWQALPSLSANETLLKYHLDKPLVACEIQYSNRDNLYYIRAKDKNSHEVSIDFLLETHPIQKTQLPEPLAQLIERYTNFGVGAHDFKGPGTGQQYLDAINQDQKGACRHRAIALMDAIQNHKKELGLLDSVLCRYVSNDCHAFVEIRLTPQSPWIAYNLGGYAADLKINKDNLPDELVKTPIKPVSGFEIQALPKLSKEQADSFERQFETWRKEKPQFNSPDAYCQQVVSGMKSKQLIECTSSDQVQAASLALETYCHRIARPVFYIHSPDDLVCSAPFVKRQKDQGQLVAGPGGPLHEFLTTHHDKANPPILIVNYDQFDADDIVRLNGLLDKEPKADGTLLPDCAVVVGLINLNKPGCYQGQDFYSRFGLGHVETCPFTTTELVPTLDSIKDKTNPDAAVFTINLCHAPDWEERLLGRWVVKKDHLHFEEGLLVKALQSGLPIVLQNGLWDNPSFCHFWKRASTLGHIEAHGTRIDISKTRFLKSEGYDWQRLKPIVQFDGEVKNTAEILNPTHFSDFFSRYQCNNELRQLDTLNGLIAAHQNKTLEVTLTRSLSEDEWGALLMACETHQVRLNCHCAPSVRLPTVLGEVPHSNHSLVVTPSVIQSTDPDVTIAQLTEKETWTVIDVSELSSKDLLTNTTGALNKEKLIFEFTQSDGALKKALANDENILLKGQFSTELADALAPLLLRSQSQRLKLVTNDASFFNYVPVEQHTVSLREKVEVLERRFSIEQIKALEHLEQESFSQSMARLISAPSNPWQGLAGLSGGITVQAFDEVNSKAKAEAFIQGRQEAVNALLDKSPFVFLTGLTGVGKSTFVEKYMVSANTKLFVGESNLFDWALDNSGQRCILFIDEANITSRQWSEFEGLFNQPPGILINGIYHQLTEKHKVVFAGNPLNYGGERKMAPLFERHGNALVFDPMPCELIYEAILKPIFANTAFENQSLPIARELLNTYRFLCACSEDEVLISPRELQMMALLVLSHAENHPEDDLAKVTAHYAHVLAKHLVPAKHLSAFEKQCPKPDLQTAIKNPPIGFVLTPSREPLYQQLNDLTALRTLRRHNRDWNEAQLYGGLGGLIIEGEPGIGKSELVIAQLRAQGFEKVSSLSTPNTLEKSFYCMPISMQKEEKETLLLKAFHEGALVIIDEINSAPMMERLLNDLLMGKTPEGKRPQNPGFMVIGTQNPTTMAGRSKPSAALKRRMTTVELPTYPHQELEFILVNRGLKPDVASLMVESYQKKLAQAKKEHLSPAPSVRDLMHAAEVHLKRAASPISLEQPTASQNQALFFSKKTHNKSKKDADLSLQPLSEKKSPSLRELDELNTFYVNFKQQTNKPNSLQTFFGMHHTLSWQWEAAEIRLKAWGRFKRMLTNTKGVDEQLKLIDYAMTLDLFKEHRSNYELTKNTKETFTINLLKELKEALQAKKPQQPPSSAKR